MPKNENKKNVRFIRKGDIIRYISADTEVVEVVRDVSIVLHMANGETVTADTTFDYELVPQEELPLPPEEDAPEPRPLSTNMDMPQPDSEPSILGGSNDE